MYAMLLDAARGFAQSFRDWTSPEAYAAQQAYTVKRSHYTDFGWKERLAFPDFYSMYSRNSLAAAAVDKTIAKTWRDLPALWEQPDKPADTETEKAIAKHFADAGIWRALMHTDRCGMVGRFGAAIIRVRDGLTWDQPVGRVTKLEDVLGIIPAWEGQLTVDAWEDRPFVETFGQPTMFNYQSYLSQDVEFTTGPQFTAKVHPSRVIIWSEDGTLNGRSDLEPGFNDLVDAEKIKGAGGEGFYKTSRASLVIQIDPETDVASAARGMGAEDPEQFAKKLSAKVDMFNGGFDRMLMLKGMGAEPINVSLPQPAEFLEGPVQSFAASMQIPYKELIGNVTGERASTEDAHAWAETCMARRTNLAIPQINSFVRRLVSWGALPDRAWEIGWPSLLDATPDQLLDRAVKKAQINSSNPELVYLVDEIRETAGDAATDEVDGWDEAEDDRYEREAAAANPPAELAPENPS